MAPPEWAKTQTHSFGSVRPSRTLDGSARYDRRRHEARVIGHMILTEIRDLLPSEVMEEVHERLLATLYQNGVLLVRDDERVDLGLELCDEKGWTPSDRVKFEQEKIAAIQQMASLFVKMPASK